jgi:hypothetical protein
MKIPQPNEEKYKKILITLGIIIAACIFLPMIISPLIYLISVLIIIGCGYLIYRYCLEYAEQSNAKKVYDAITVKGIYNVSGIAKDLGWDNAKTRRVLDFCFRMNYLDDYFRIGDEVRRKQDDKDDLVAATRTKTTAKKCSHCGGVAEYPEGEKSICVFCGGVIEKD